MTLSKKEGMIQNVQSALLDLDKLDVMLIREMEQDARVSYLALSSKLGTSQPTVSRRMKRLVDRGIMAFAVIPDYAVLGYGTILALAINAPLGTVNALAEQLASANSIKYLWRTAGQYNLMAVAFYRNIEEYLRLFPAEIGAIPENVRIETMLEVKKVKSSWSNLTDQDVAAASLQGFILTELDLSVIRGLEKSPRVPVKELAHDIGASRSAVGFSLSKLISRGIIRVIGVPGAVMFGYSVRGVILIQVHPSSLNTLPHDLKVCPFIKDVHLTIGAFNCIAWASFQNTNRMYDFLDQDLGNMSGVVNHQSMVVLRVQKRSSGLLSGNTSGMNGPQ